jgi:putative transposase
MNKNLTEFTEKERQQAFDRYNTIASFIDGNIKLTVIANNVGIAYQTLYSWVRKYRSKGLVGLIDKERSDSGKRRSVNKEMKTLVEGLALQKPPLSIAAIHRKVIDVAKKNNWHIPVYQTVYSIVKSLPKALTTLALEGNKEYKDKYDLLYPRKSTHSNEIWQADHSLMDIYLIDDKGKARRPWLTIIIDDYSRTIAGYYLTFYSPNTQNTSLALHQAIWYKSDKRWRICGIPDIFYTDHGSDFTSVHMQQVSADIKMNLSFSLAGQPRGRGIIERFFETVNQLFLNDLPGYTPNGKLPEKTPKMDINEFEVLLKEFLIGNYNMRIHSEIKIEPQEKWFEDGFIPRMPNSLEELDLLLLTETKERKVHQDGIHFQNIKYIEPTLAAYVGEKVVIRYDPRDIVEIRVFYEGKFLCRAISYELAGQNISLKDIIKARNKRRKELKKEISDRKELVDAYIEIHYEKDDIETQKPENSQKPEKGKLKRYFYE